MTNLYRGPSKDASYQISIYSAKRFHRRIFFFRNQPMRNKNCLWRPCLSTDRDEMSNAYRGPSIDASFQVMVHLARRFQRNFSCRNQPIRNTNCLWWSCLWTDQDEMSNRYRGSSIDASDKFTVHLAKRFQKGRFKKSASQKQELPVATMCVNVLGQNVQS